MQTEQKLLLKGSEVALILGICRAQAYKLMAAGAIPVVRVFGSRSVRVPRAALLRYIEEQTQQPEARC
jgi:excisionase family DNA binding protein